jgi:hypothetical protein
MPTSDYSTVQYLKVTVDLELIYLNNLRMMKLSTRISKCDGKSWNYLLSHCKSIYWNVTVILE